MACGRQVRETNHAKRHSNRITKCSKNRRINSFGLLEKKGIGLVALVIEEERSVFKVRREVVGDHAGLEMRLQSSKSEKGRSKEVLGYENMGENKEREKIREVKERKRIQRKGPPNKRSKEVERREKRSPGSTLEEKERRKEGKWTEKKTEKERRGREGKYGKSLSVNEGKSGAILRGCEGGGLDGT